MIETKELGRYVRRARERAGLTQEQLAEKLFVSKQAVSNWERGANRIDEAVRERLEETLNISLTGKPESEENMNLDIKKLEDIKNLKELYDAYDEILAEVPIDSAFEHSVRRLLHLLLMCVTGYELYINGYHKRNNADEYGIDGWQCISSNLFALLDDMEEYPIPRDNKKAEENHRMRDKIEYMCQTMGGELFEDFDDDGKRVSSFEADCARRGEYDGYDLLDLIPGIPNSLYSSFRCAVYMMAEVIADIA